jgi:hypothetical protein
VIGMKPDTRETDTVFAELIYADAQWLREEFDALIAACFGEPPAAPPPAPPRLPPHRRRPASGRWGQVRLPPPTIAHPVITPAAPVASRPCGRPCAGIVSQPGHSPQTLRKETSEDRVTDDLNQLVAGLPWEPSHSAFQTSADRSLVRSADGRQVG